MDDRRRQATVSPFVFTAWEYFEHLKTHRSFITVFTLSAMLSALALTYVYSEKFQATTTILFSPEEVTRLQVKMQEAEAFGAPMPGADFKVIGKTLEELAKSEGLLRKVVDELDLDVPEEKDYSGPWYKRYYELAKDYGKKYALEAWAILKYGMIPEDNPTVEAVIRLAADISIEARDSYVFHLSAVDKHPLRVAAIVDTVARELVELLLERDRAPAREKYGQFEQLLEAKRQEIREFEAEIDGLLETNGVASVDQEIQLTLAKRYDLESDRNRLLADIMENDRKLAAYEEKLALKRDYGRKSQSKRRARENDQPGADDSTLIRPDDFSKLASEKLFTDVQLEGLRARRASLGGSLESLDARLEGLPALSLRISQLKTDLDRANDDFGVLNLALQELAVREIDQQSELKIQHLATPPSAPISPIKVYHVGLAGFLGFTFAIGLAYLFAYFNVRLFVDSRGIKARGSGDAGRRASDGGRAEDRRRATDTASTGTDERRLRATDPTAIDERRARASDASAGDERRARDTETAGIESADLPEVQNR